MTLNVTQFPSPNYKFWFLFKNYLQVFIFITINMKVLIISSDNNIWSNLSQC